MTLHDDLDNFKILISATAEYMEIPEVYVEKDYWVTYLLYNLYNSEYKELIAFKGGTSLSKGYKIIDRFSEDVDLVVIKRNYRENKDNEKIIKSSFKEIVKNPLIYDKEHVDNKNSKFYKKKIVNYPKQTSFDDYGHAVAHIILEMNFFSEPSPIKIIPITTYIHDFLISKNEFEDIKTYSLEPFSINLLCTTRTFIEKILSLYRGAHKGLDILKSRIRHFYDIHMLLNKNDDIIQIYNNEIVFERMLRHAIGEEKYHEMFCDIEEFLPFYESNLGLHIEEYKEDLRSTYQNNFITMLYKKVTAPSFDEVFQTMIDINNFIREKRI